MGKLIDLVRWLFGPAPKQSDEQEFGPKVSTAYECGWSRAHFDTDSDVRRMNLQAEREEPMPESLRELVDAASKSRADND